MERGAAQSTSTASNGSNGGAGAAGANGGAGGGANAREIDRILAAQSLYDVLGISHADATPALLRKAYLRRSMQCHPDKSTHPRATEAFQRVAEAYDTLSDAPKKRDYDLRTSRGTRADPSGSAGSGPVVVEVSAEQAFEMFAEAMNQFAEENGIAHERQSTIFDSLASAVLYVDGWINPARRGKPAAAEAADEEEADSSASQVPRDDATPPSRLQTWARNLATLGSIVSTASQIVRTQQERERLEQEARERAAGGGTGPAAAAPPGWAEAESQRAQPPRPSSYSANSASQRTRSFSDSSFGSSQDT